MGHMPKTREHLCILFGINIDADTNHMSMSMVKRESFYYNKTTYNSFFCKIPIPYSFQNMSFILIKNLVRVIYIFIYLSIKI